MSDIGGWLMVAVLLIAAVWMIRFYNRNRWW